MEPIVFINRQTGKEEIEKVYGEKALEFLYGRDLLSRIFGAPLLHLYSKIPFFSTFYGFWQKLPFSRKKVKPFVEAFGVDTTEFQDPIDSYSSFNDFFIRKLKTEARPIAPDKNVAIIPADGRYYFYQNLTEVEGFVVKGEKFCLATLLDNNELANKYQNGSMMMARLCPTDYHRFHFPCDCVPSVTHFINGWLYSVNPIAIKKDIQIFTRNKRTLCELKTDLFGDVLYLEIGATNVGSIHETYTPNTFCKKGSEKGYFSFGASALILLFQKDKILFDSDLVTASSKGMEIKCLMGQSMGKSI